MRKLPALILIVLLSSQLVFALPDSSTQKSGNDCRRGHSMSYSYSITAPKTVTEGDSFTVSLAFKISGSSQVTGATRTVSATLSGSGFTIDQASQKLSSNTGEWTVTATSPGVKTLTFNTELVIRESTRHSGYKATYKDSVSVDITVEKKAAPPVTPPVTPPTTPPSKPPVNTTANSTNSSQGSVNPPSPPITKPPSNDSSPNNTSGGTNTWTMPDDNTQTVTQDFEVGLEQEPDETSWIITRAMGFVAYALLWLSVFIGVMKRTKSCTMMKYFKHHCDISLLSVIFALFHGISNIFDKFVWNLSVDRVFIPSFGSEMAIWISLGVISFYLMAIITFTTLRKSLMKKLGCSRWRMIHMSSYVAFVFVFFHSLMVGSDLKGGLIQILFILSGLVLFAATFYSLGKSSNNAPQNNQK